MKVFVAGSRAMPKLNDDVETRLSSVMSAGATVILGDAKGADSLVQTYLKSHGYSSVVVYASNGAARNNMGNWPVETVHTESRTGTFDFYVAKDRKMAEDADYGFLIWDGKSKGTLNDAIMLTDRQKTILMYFLPRQKFYQFKTSEKLLSFLSSCGGDTMKVYENLAKKNGLPKSAPAKPIANQEQISLFDHA